MAATVEPARYVSPAMAARRRLETWLLIIPLLVLALVGGNISMASLPAHVAFVAMAFVAVAIMLLDVFRRKSAAKDDRVLLLWLHGSWAFLIFSTLLATLQNGRRDIEFWLVPLGIQLPYFYAVLALQRRDWAVASWLRALFIVVGGLCLEALATAISFYAQTASLQPPSMDIVPIPFRLYVVLNNPNVFGAVLAMTAPAAVGYAFWSNRRWERIAIGALLTGLGWALLATGSRTSQIAAAVSMMVTLLTIGATRGWSQLIWHEPRVRMIAAALTVAVIVVVSSIVLIESRGAGRGGSETRRFELWQTAIHIGAQNPLFGVGSGGFSTAQLGMVSAPPTPVERHAHNLFLNFFAENGLIGLGALLLWLAVLITATWRAWKASNNCDRAWLSGLVGGIIAFGIVGLLDDPMAQMAPLSLLLLFAALIASKVPYPGWRSYSGPVAPWYALLFSVLIAIAATSFTIRYAAVWNAAQTNPNNSAQTWTDTAQTLDQAAAIDSGDALTAAQAAVAWVQVSSTMSGDAQSNALNKAISDYERVVKLDPAFAVHHLNLGVLLLGRGSVEEAIDELAEAVRKAPASGIAHLNYGIALEQANRTDLAVAEYKQALTFGIGHKPLFWQATATRRSVLDVTPAVIGIDDTPRALASGLAALGRGDATGARDEFTAAIALGGGDAATAALIALGDLDSAQGNQSVALDDYRAAFSRIDRYGVLGPGHAGDQSYAVNAFNRFAYISDFIPGVLTLDIDPERAIRFVTLANALRNAGDYAAAAHIYQRILIDNPGYSAAESGLVQLGNAGP